MCVYIHIEGLPVLVFEVQTASTGFGGRRHLMSSARLPVEQGWAWVPTEYPFSTFAVDILHQTKMGNFNKTLA